VSPATQPRNRTPFTISPARRRAAIAAVAVLLLVWISAIVLRPIGPRIQDPIDLAWYALIQQIRFPALTALSLVIDALGKAPLDHVVVALAAAALAVSGRWRSGLLLVVAGSVDGVQVQVLKLIADRMRPDHPLIATGNASYPSGHTAIAALVAVGIALAVRKRWVWVCSLSAIAVVAVSRTVLNVHWMSDVVVGGAVGAATMLLVWTLAPAVLVDRQDGRAGAAARVPWAPVAAARTARRAVLTQAEDA
jgi:membrane-associated phospholipid phosphatase